MPAKTEKQRKTQKDYETRTGYAAQKNYIAEKCTRITFTFSPVDSDILDHFETLTESRTAYIKRLIREDMKRNKGE